MQSHWTWAKLITSNGHHINIFQREFPLFYIDCRMLIYVKVYIYLSCLVFN